MAKISNPIRFSDHFQLDPKLLKKAGVLNPCLNVDTGLFIDPMLLKSSKHPEIKNGAAQTYEAHFTTVIKLLAASQKTGDTAWRNADRMLSFPEVKGTCLGYGANSVSGSGSGRETTTQLITTAKEIVDLGVRDPDLFVSMALFEEGFGPDRISDMTTNVILKDLLAFNDRVLKIIPAPRRAVTITLKNGQTFTASLPTNPYVRKGWPIILVPHDILRDLPIAKDWEDVADAASKNAALRRRVNHQVAELWTAKTLKDKQTVKNWAMRDKDSFASFLEMVRSAAATAYDVTADPRGELLWQEIAATIAHQVPLKIEQPKSLDIEGVVSVVEQIIRQFQFLIEDRRLSEELYHEGVPRPEKSAQRLFFAVAHSYCKANNLDITPEADTGNGPVDFKFSKGFNGRALVEIKLSTNTKLVKGYTRQLETYKTAEETTKGFYLVLDVGQLGRKQSQLTFIQNRAKAQGQSTSPIIYVNGRRKASASKL